MKEVKAILLNKKIVTIKTDPQYTNEIYSNLIKKIDNSIETDLINDTITLLFKEKQQAKICHRSLKILLKLPLSKFKSVKQDD